MDSSDCIIINKDNFDATDVQFQSQNQQPNEISLIEQVTEKNELKKILETVSILCKPNPIEINGNMTDATDIQEIKNENAISEREIEIVSVNLLKKEPFKVAADMSTDGDEIEIVDVLLLGNHHQKKVSNELKKTFNNPSQKCSSSVKNFIDVSDLLEIKNENVITSVNHPSQHCSSSVKNISNAVDIQEIKKKKAICEKDVEIISVNLLKSFDVFATNSVSKESILVNSSDTHSSPVSNGLKKSDQHCPEKQFYGETAIETIEIEEHETFADSAICDDTMDFTNEIDEHSYSVEYDFSHTPMQITGSWKEFSGSKKNNFTRGCKWAPDGSCIMTCSEDNKLRIFNLPPQLWNFSQWSDISELETALSISEGDLIYDYCWYPLMNSNDSATCCFVSTSRKSTVHLWDAYTGELRCSYRSFNHLDELVTPHSICFDSDGEKLFCGFQNVIRVFDVNRPGRLFEERQIYAYKTGQCGIISCFAFTSADKNISAAGSYQKTIGLYAEPDGELTCLLEGQANGVTQLQFSPDGKYLYSGGRKDPEILCWDLRNLGTVLFSLRRSYETNQRIYFDISRCGKYVASGNQNGVITFWDVTKEPKMIENEFPVMVPLQFYLAHDDCVNGISFHPSHPFLCSSSGQRKFPILLDDESDDIFSYKNEKKDNSLRLWWIGKLNK